MIIVFALDDKYVVENAYNHDKKIFGIGYFYRKNHSYFKAGKTENIFITAHGNDLEIGNINNKVSLNAEKLAKIIHNDFLPTEYSGNIYIFTCNSAPIYNSDFAEELGKLRKYSGTIYGCEEKVSYPIYKPGNSKWEPAQ